MLRTPRSWEITSKYTFTLLEVAFSDILWARIGPSPVWGRLLSVLIQTPETEALLAMCQSITINPLSAADSGFSLIKVLINKPLSGLCVISLLFSLCLYGHYSSSHLITLQFISGYI